MPASRDSSLQSVTALDAFSSALAATTQALVCVLDVGGRILLFNDACERATGFSRDEVLGADAREFVIPPEEAPAFGEMLAYVWQSGQPSPQVGHWLTKDGDRLLIAWSNRPVHGDDGAILYLVTSGLDISERAQTSEALRALEGNLENKLAEVGRLAQEQAALRRVATLVAAEASPEQIFDAVSKQSARVLDAWAAAVFRFESDETATVVGRWDRVGIPVFGLGANVPLNSYSAIGRVRATGEAARVDDYQRVPGELGEAIRKAGLRATIAAPITVAGRPWGGVAVATRAKPFPPESEARLGSFSELVSVAIESSEAREELRASRARIVQAADAERKRLERNLHDGAQQRLASLALGLRLARSQMISDPDRAEQLLQDASVELEGALRELRELARGLHPAVLSDHGLGRAIEVLVDRSALRVEVEAPEGRLPEAVETAAYYIASEALANVAKHAEATRAKVSVRQENAILVVEVSDNGLGGADGSGSGIVGLHDRADALGGSLTLHSPPGDGTILRAQLPLLD